MQMTEQDGADLVDAVNAASAAGYSMWHLGYWPNRGWNASLYKNASRSGGMTCTRTGRTAAEAVRNALALPDWTDDEKEAQRFNEEIGKVDLLRAKPEIPVHVVLRFTAALKARADAG